MSKTVLQLDAAGYFVGYAVADESPLEPGVFLLPAGCIDEPAPQIPSGKVARRVNGSWLFVDPPQQPEPQPEDPRQQALQAIEELEAIQIKQTARMEREERLKEAEAYALNTLGLNPAQLYAAASQPGAPTAFITYKKMKDIDNQIVALRAQL